ncbi:hypothetical protein B484DRAFT_446238 [Ochromonadaceae sp. CCMP2298]|nr:hypothetical protein B484DRAFT_446238 [Ochromonadaceae sp. CCMP2298]
MFARVALFASAVAVVQAQNHVQGTSFLQLAPIPTARRGSVGGVLLSKEDIPEVWVVGGSNSELTEDVGKSVQIYNTAFDTWTEGPQMDISRSDHGCTALDEDHLYVAGGMSACLNPRGGNVCNISAVSRYSSEGWVAIAPMNVARRGLSLAADEELGVVYAVGGMDCQQDCYGLPVTYLTTVERLDIKTGLWSFLPSLKVGRRDLGLAVLGGKLYAAGGCGGDGNTLDYKNCLALDTVEVYTPGADSWETLAPLLTPRHGFATGVYGTQIILAGGTAAAGIDAASAQSNLTSSVDSYDPQGDAWYPIGSMPDPRDGLMKTGAVVGTTMFLISGSTAAEAYVNTNEVITLRC